MVSFKKLNLVFLFASVVVLASCQTVDLYEKLVPIPAHKWDASFKPSFTFNITDTVSRYRVYIVLRHNEKYNYNNIWLNLTTRIPGDTAVNKAQFELPLANSEGWLSKESAMDDLYEHRILITPGNEGFAFRKPGEYTYTLEHIMRENPLANVLNAGLRIEKIEAR
jgi:gliding motility-associated lipoprotein GldH